MNSERYRLIDALFERALELAPAGREAFLEAETAGDADLRQAVADLLAADDRARSFLDGSALAGGLPAAGTRMGAYRLERLLGRGGMGAVYLARRDDLDRPVALKFVDAPYRHPQLVPRFLAERQILARLEHPGIARLYDAGATEDGVPFVVLEYVDGEPLDSYCDRRRLPLGPRLALFDQLVEAVAHAHQSLLVHRDIKPSNVWVTADGQVKLLDFGIALRLDTPAGTAAPTETRPMTPGYASPEQVRGEPLTTATDVYSLGVVLFELLAGRCPYRLASEATHEIEAAILGQEPERPSAALARPGASPPAEAIAAARGTTAADLRRALAGDLDTIVQTALSKDPARRYRSVLELQADLERWRDDRPIAARPDSTLYRLGKFVRRHRAGVAAGVLGAALLTGLVASLFVQRDRATRERDRAQAALAFVVGVFDEDAPYQQGVREGNAREILATAATRAERELGSDPALQAALYRALGQATAGIGEYAAALPLLTRSLEYARRHHPDSPELAGPLEAMGWAEFLSSDLTSSLQHLEEAVVLRRKHQPGSMALAESLHLLATVLSERELVERSGELDRVEALFEEALALCRRLAAPNGREATANLAGLVKVARVREDSQEAERLAREALAATLALYGPEHPETASGRRNLGLVLVDVGRANEAEPLFREALATLEKTLPGDHPEIATAAGNLGDMLNAAGRASEAEPLLRRSYELTRTRLGEEHRNTLQALGLLAAVLQNLGRSEEAAELRERELAGTISVFGEESLPTARAQLMLARTLASTGALERAESLARRSLAVRERILPAGDPDIKVAYRHLGSVLLKAGKPVDAEPFLRLGLDDQRRIFGAEHFQTAAVELSLASCLVRLGRLDEATLLLDHGRAVVEREFPPEHPLVRSARKTADELAAARRTV